MSLGRTGLRSAAIIAGQIVLLALISEAARRGAALLPFPVPGSAIGLIVLYLLLATGWLPLPWIERGAALLVRHLGLFLVPFGVGFMAFGDAMATQGIALLVVLIACTALGIVVTGMTSVISRHLSHGARPSRSAVNE